MRKLHRSEKNKIVAGILGGLGEYFEIDPVMLRLVFVIFVVVTGIFPGVIIYLLAIFIIPKAPASPTKNS